jgi:hypothetical protein
MWMQSLASISEDDLITGHQYSGKSDLCVTFEKCRLACHLYLRQVPTCST